MKEYSSHHVVVLEGAAALVESRDGEGEVLDGEEHLAARHARDDLLAGSISRRR
jgi:hypothetical protein